MIDIVSRLKSLAVGGAAAVETADVATEFATGSTGAVEGAWAAVWVRIERAKHCDCVRVAEDVVLICGTQILLFLGKFA